MGNESIIFIFLKAYHAKTVTLRRVGPDAYFRVVFLYDFMLEDYKLERMSEPLSLTEGAKLAGDVFCNNANHICMILEGFVQHGIDEPGFPEAVSALQETLKMRKTDLMSAALVVKQFVAGERTILCTRAFENSPTYNISFLSNSDFALTTGWVSDPLDPVMARELADSPNCENRWSALAILDSRFFKSLWAQ